MVELTDVQYARYQEYLALSAQIRREAEERSTFKLGQLIRVCQDLSFSFNPNPTCREDVLIPTNPHDHDDPEQHFCSRVMGWDSFGRIEVALEYGDNPHSSQWPWSEDKICPYFGPDWAEGSTFSSGMKIYYTWDQGHDFFKIKPGMELEAVLEMPHLRRGDWRVRYDNTSSGYITRVLNESQMRLIRSDLPRPPERQLQ